MRVYQTAEWRFCEARKGGARAASAFAPDLKFRIRTLRQRPLPVHHMQFPASNQARFGGRQVEAVNIEHQVGIHPLMKEQLVAFGRPDHGKEDRRWSAGGQEAALSGEQLFDIRSVGLDGETLRSRRIEKGNDIAGGWPGRICSLR